jgi:hypothetical protein
MILPTTTKRRSERHRIEDADPMLLADGRTSYERTVCFEELDERGTPIRTDVYAVYTRTLDGGFAATFFRKPFEEVQPCLKS